MTNIYIKHKTAFFFLLLAVYLHKKSRIVNDKDLLLLRSCVDEA